MASPRLSTESFLDYRARLKAEGAALQKSLKGGVVVSTTAMNRKARRDITKHIPADDAVVLAKVCEMMNDGTTIEALQMLYDSKTTAERKTMISQFRGLIDKSANENDDEFRDKNCSGCPLEKKLCGCWPGSRFCEEAKKQ